MPRISKGLALCLAATGWIALRPVAADDKASVPDEDFLEYLGTLDSEADDWTLFADQDPQPSTPKPSSSTEEDAKSASKQK
ncbi:MAG TPA: hypothetical protein VFS24_12290 [Steroidobacteraceae bacterium]|nr:hypothetical protein [Steroidobacteraceae bacterium]